jgi:hypothetical protein
MKMNLKKRGRIYQIVTLLFCFLGLQLSYGQDTCATAMPITVGTTTVDAINGANIATACATTATLAEWYSYTPAQNYSVTVTSDLLVNICKDTRFNVYTGNCGALTCYSGDDDSGIIACNSGNTSTYLSTKTFDVFAGVTYYIAWDNRWSTAGFDFQLIENPFVPNLCNSAVAITAGITTVDAIDQGNVSTSCSTASAGKWFSYTPTQNYHATISSDLAVNLCKDTNFTVYRGSCANNALICVSSDDNSGILECNVGNTNSFLSKKTFDVTAGTTYYIVWDNKWSAEGFDFELTEDVIVVPINYNNQAVSTVNSTYNICVVDMNNDGKDDIAGVSTNNLKVHYQQNDGTFAISNFAVPGTSFLPSWSLAAGDYNRDGYNDLLLGSGSGLSFWESDGTGTSYFSRTPGQYIFCQRTNFIDIDNDGNLDAFSCHDVDPNVYYLNDGAGNWTYYQSGTTPGAYMLGITASGGNYASLWTDFDNDGDRDMFISKCSGPPCELHRNDGNGVFTDISAQAQINVQPIQSWSSAIADFDNDGDMDIMIGSNGSVGNKFFRNNLDTSNEVEEAYSNITAGSGLDLDTSTNRDYVAYDFDNDGLVDILGSGNKIMFNQGDNQFSPVSYPAISVGAIGDLNDDGFLDILNNNIIRYAIPNGNNWFKVILQGIQSNTNGIGARIEIYGAFGKQIRDIRSGEGFEFMSSLNAHFGLGQATAIDQLVVKWPSGIVDTYLNPQINADFRVTEGTTLAVNGNANAVFSVIPNPAKQFITINLNSGSTEKLTSAQIFDLTGRLIMETPLNSSKINVDSLQSGTYLLLLQNEKGKGYSQKFIKE